MATRKKSVPYRYAFEYRNAPLGAGQRLGISPNIPFDPEPMPAGAAHCWNGCPIRGARNNLNCNEAVGNDAQLQTGEGHPQPGAEVCRPI
jgi:hypothetical protein